MAKFDSVTHKKKVFVALEKDDAVRRMFFKYLAVEDDDRIVKFSTFVDAVVITSIDDKFKAYARDFRSKDTVTIEDLRNFFRKILQYEASSNS